MAHASSTSYSGVNTEEITTNIDEEVSEEHLGSVSSSALGQACGATGSGSSVSSRALQNACDIIPKFWKIEVSDTGDCIPWNDVALLKRGDHIAWLRFASYYHHAIVVEVNEDFTITVVELSWTGIAKNVRQTRTCGCSPLYRVYYPNDALAHTRELQLPSYTRDEVVQRAEDLVNPDTSRATTTTVRKGWRPWNTCEHTATWCKVDCRRCGQWRILFFCTFLTYMRRPIESLIHVFLIVSSFKCVANYNGTDDSVRNDTIGEALMVIFEMVYLIIVAFLIRCDFKKGSDFISKEDLCPKKRMWYAFLKTLLQSIVMVGMAIGFGVGVKNAIKKQHGPWISSWGRIGVEAGLGLLGGIIGNVLGFLLFFFIPRQAYFNKLSSLWAHIGRFFPHRGEFQPIQ